MFRHIIPFLIILLALDLAADPADDSVKPSLRLSGKATVQGTPEVHMWGAGLPQSDIAGGGFPVLQNAHHGIVFKDAITAGGYNHHAQLAHHNGVFYAAWSNHPKGEDASGQRVLFATSTDGVNWRPWAEAFPPPAEVRGWGEGFGYYSVAGQWHVYENEVYLTTRLYNFVGWENADRTSRVSERDDKHYFQRFEHLGILARKVSPVGELGPAFSLSSRMNRAQDLAYPFISYGAPSHQTVADAINNAHRNRPRISGPLSQPVDDARLVEPTVYETTDGLWIAIIRDDKFSHRKYVSFSNNQGSSWSKALPTDIPDSPSLDESLRAPDGSILLIGNHCATGFDNPRDPRHPQNPYHYDRDILDVAVSADGYLFTHTFVLRSGLQEWRVPRRVVRGRGGGPQYPSPLIVGDNLYVLYSFGKEDIWCTSVPLADILKAPSASR